jgi:hypothetical protein
MRAITYAYVRALLIKTFIKTFARQFYLKLTKLTRRSGGARAFGNKVAAGYDFLRDMSYYNWDVIRRSRRCLKQLAADNVHEVLVYGERDVTEVLYDLTFEIPVRVKALGEDYESRRNLGRSELPIEVDTAGREKIIVASLVNVEERVRRLRELRVDNERIVLLN